MPDSQLTRIPGIGPATARLLTESGFASIEAIASAAYGDLAKIQGFGEIRAAVVITAAQALVSADATPAAAASGKVKKNKKKKKQKKDKKGKGKDKGKKKKDKKGKKKKDKKRRQK